MIRIAVKVTDNDTEIKEYQEQGFSIFYFKEGSLNLDYLTVQVLKRVSFDLTLKQAREIAEILHEELEKVR
jgi:hypothetical protein